MTLPIARYSTVEVAARPARKLSIVHRNERLEKLEWAMVLAARALEIGPIELHVLRTSDLQVGKGMGSSTADIVGAVHAMAEATGCEATPDVVAQIATTIESSDGTMHPGSVAFSQRSGELLANYEWFPRLHVVTVVPATSLETASVDFRTKTNLGRQFDEILDSLAAASANRNTSAFVEAAGESALLNQRYVRNSYFESLVPLVGQFGGRGLAIAHTGTMVGMLFDGTDSGLMAAEAAVTEIAARFPETDVARTSTDLSVNSPSGVYA